MQKQKLVFYKQWFNFKCLVIFAFACLLSNNLNAQVFEDDTISSDTVTNSVVVENKTTNNVAPKQSVTKATSVRGAIKRPINQKKNISSNNVKVSEVKQLNQVDPNEKIYLYMRDFKISRDMHNRTGCNMTFYIYSTANQKITNISYRLKWPDMETPVSFNNVEPKQTASIKYALLGKGCYEMDSVPNIIVNRCRIKGISQEKCSSMIQWSK